LAGDVSEFRPQPRRAPHRALQCRPCPRGLARPGGDASRVWNQKFIQLQSGGLDARIKSAHDDFSHAANALSSSPGLTRRSSPYARTSESGHWGSETMLSGNTHVGGFVESQPDKHPPPRGEGKGRVGDCCALFTMPGAAATAIRKCSRSSRSARSTSRA
jgi:hypothetical protein